ncbi:MAG: phage holin family protein [Pseudomonadota bacterium]|jgi:Protein of unknown function (DUF1469).|nr:MAG: phage holin family protein [Pseudomonadota bacterium]
MAQDTTYVPPVPPTVSPARPVREPDTAAGLLRRLADDLSTLLRKELALATAEVSRSVGEAKRGITGIASGGAVLFAGFLVLLAAAVSGLSQVMETWLAALIVGAVVAIIGFVMLQSGRKKLQAESFRPERTQESLRHDREMLQRRMQ